ncbi:MAG: pyruvate carboxylase subunit B, partial [Actinobacteria bacterium]|nr:pyruvate carboxylase subunit B [Actinomycetota bacterium]
RGLYGRAPGPMDPDVVAKVLCGTAPLDPDVRPGSMATTTYADVEAEIGDLAKSEEDVLMYALFPNEARAYLTANKDGLKNAVFMMGEEIKSAKEGDQSMDVNQIKELVKIIEASDVSEIVIEEGGAKIAIRKGGVSAQEAAPVVAAPAAAAAPSAAPVLAAATSPNGDQRPSAWKQVTAPMVGTF